MNIPYEIKNKAEESYGISNCLHCVPSQDFNLKLIPKNGDICSTKCYTSDSTDMQRETNVTWYLIYLFVLEQCLFSFI